MKVADWLRAITLSRPKFLRQNFKLISTKNLPKELAGSSLLAEIGIHFEILKMLLSALYRVYQKKNFPTTLSHCPTFYKITFAIALILRRRAFRVVLTKIADFFTSGQFRRSLIFAI